MKGMSVENPSDTLSTDTLPMILQDRGFDTAMRGYDRRQVDAYVAHLDDDMRATAAERDAVAARSADLAAQLASSSAQIESLRRQLRVATETITDATVEGHVRTQLAAAEVDAARIRAEAEHYRLTTMHTSDEAAERVRNAARAEADEILAEATQRHADADETFRQRIAEAERYRTEVEAQLAQQVELARQQEDQLTREAEAVRTRLDAEAEGVRASLDAEAAEVRARLDADSERRRQVADEDFVITLRARRTAEAQTSAEQLAAAQAQADAIVATAQNEARQLTEAAAAEVARMHAEREQTHASLRELHARLGQVIDSAQ